MPSRHTGRWLAPAVALPTLVAMVLMVAAATTPPAAAQETTAGEQRIDVARFLELVEANSLQLANARIERGLADAQEDLVRSQVYPFVAGRVGYARNFLDIEQDFPIGADTSGGGDFAPLVTQPIDVNSDNDLTLGFTVEQLLFDAGVFRALEASRQFSELTGTIYQAARQGLLTEAKRLFFQTLLLQEVLAVRRSSEATALASFREAQQRFANGLASQLEVLQAEVDFSITQPDTSQAERNLNVALQNLKNFAGLEQDEELVLIGSLDQFPALPDFDGAFEKRAMRPDYQSLLGERRLRELNVAAERASYFPTLSASLAYGRQASDDGFDFSDGTGSLTAGVTLTVPVFFGGSRVASVNRAQLELERVSTAIAIRDDDIATELETIRLRLEESTLRIESADRTRAIVERTLRVSQTSFDNGLATQREVNDTRVNLELARLNYLSAVFDYLSAYFDWQLATGQGDVAW